MYLPEELETRRRVLGNEHPHTLYAMYNVVDLLVQLGTHEEAEPLALECYALNVKVYGNEHQETIDAINLLIHIYDAWDKPEEAKKYREMLPEEDISTEDSE